MDSLLKALIEERSSVVECRATLQKLDAIIEEDLQRGLSHQGLSKAVSAIWNAAVTSVAGDESKAESTSCPTLRRP